MATRNLIDKMVYSTVCLGVACLLGGLLSQHFREGLALFCGAAWGALNLFFLKIFLQRLVVQTSRKNLNYLFLIVIKWPLLYLGGYCLLKTKYLPPLYLLSGFSILFGVIFLLGLTAFRSVKSHE